MHGGLCHSQCSSSKWSKQGAGFVEVSQGIVYDVPWALGGPSVEAMLVVDQPLRWFGEALITVP